MSSSSFRPTMSFWAGPDKRSTTSSGLDVHSIHTWINCSSTTTSDKINLTAPQVTGFRLASLINHGIHSQLSKISEPTHTRLLIRNMAYTVHSCRKIEAAHELLCLTNTAMVMDACTSDMHGDTDTGDKHNTPIWEGRHNNTVLNSTTTQFSGEPTRQPSR